MRADIDERPLDKYMLLISLLIGLGTFLDGYDLLNISVAMPFLINTFHLTSAMQGLLGTIVFVGGAVGAIVFGLYSDARGRRSALIVDLVFFFFASLASAFVSSPIQLLILRALIGFGIGADIASAPTLISEIAPKRSRGLLLGLSLLMMPLGGLVSATVAFLAFTSGLSANIIWRLIFGLGAIPALVVIAIRLLVPESPRWLALKGRIDELEAAKKRLGVSVVPEQRVGRPNALRFAYSTAAWAAAGVMSVFTIFTPIILQKLGEMNYLSMLRVTLVIWVFAVLGSMFSAVTQDILGRKTVGALGMAILGTSALILGAFYGIERGMMLLITVSLAMFSSFMIVGSAYTLQSEVNPTGLRGSLGGLSFAVNRLVSFAVGAYTPIALELGKLGSFLFLIALGLIILLLIYLFIGIETKGLSLEEISVS